MEHPSYGAAPARVSPPIVPVSTMMSGHCPAAGRRRLVACVYRTGTARNVARRGFRPELVEGRHGRSLQKGHITRCLS